jgi:G:T-mismatch repair DNA endonuclease (very short patch repair protein)
MQALKSFPKTFGLTELTKGYFPHKFNTDENQNYIGEYPSKEMYGYEEMVKVEQHNFDAWYETVKNTQFNFRQEMYKYCKSDVDILRRGCTELRRLFMEITPIDPFQYITNAGVCMADFRYEFIPEKTIAIHKEIPSDNYSIKSIKWLKYLSTTQGINIKHACNGGEPIINLNGKRLKVDGSYGMTVYQFHGCYYHGCNKCYTDLTVNKVSKKYMEELHSKTAEQDRDIIAAGYKLVTICEYDFDTNTAMKNVTLTEYDLIEPPKIRDSFFGGRTEPFKLIHDFKEQN